MWQRRWGLVAAAVGGIGADRLGWGWEARGRGSRGRGLRWLDGAMKLGGGDWKRWGEGLGSRGGGRGAREGEGCRGGGSGRTGGGAVFEARVAAGGRRWMWPVGLGGGQ
ncbi:unnamed protein product [Cuscuta epithymum]|uniref:Uncharacterized protein n=1 Tax=Cuscuta epithymum TaxID=186058 RepID=A0AAV0CJW4_9ASTE|nr:unnamed protein product [Cuscuta epithymum]